MITVHGRATSSNVQAVMWLVGELGLPHRRIDRGHVHGGLDDPEYRAINPHGLVPAIEDDGVAVFESAAILRYLAAEYAPGSSFWPESARERAAIDRWAEWAKTTLAPAFTVPIFWARVRTLSTDRDEAALSRGIAAFETHLAKITPLIRDDGFIHGPELTLTDILVGHVLFRYYDIDIPRAEMPAMRGYYDRLAERPAYKEHVAISYDALRVEGA